MAQLSETTLKALKWCGIFERKLRPLGWHVALTGSALYGRDDRKPPEDIDIILYPNNDDQGREHQPEPIQHSIIKGRIYLGAYFYIPGDVLWLGTPVPDLEPETLEKVADTLLTIARTRGAKV